MTLDNNSNLFIFIYSLPFSQELKDRLHRVNNAINKMGHLAMPPPISQTVEVKRINNSSELQIGHILQLKHSNHSL